MMNQDEWLVRKLRKSVERQADFIRQSVFFLIGLGIFGFIYLMYKNEDFLIAFGLIFLVGFIYLVFKGLTVFVFNKIGKWEENKYHEQLMNWSTRSQQPEVPANPEEEHVQPIEEVTEEDYLDLKSSEDLIEVKPQKWDESDLV